MSIDALNSGSERVESHQNPPDLPQIESFSYPICWERMVWDQERRSLWVLRPTDFEPLLNDEEVRHRNELDDYMPYWAQVWAGSFVLADALASRAWPAGHRCLEIGCGLGLAGLAALDLGLQVDFTDYEPLAYEFCMKSAEANGYSRDSYNGFQLDYRQPISKTYPLILGGEVLYEVPLIRQVSALIKVMLEPDGEAWLVDPYRSACDQLDKILSEFHLVAETREQHSITNRGEKIRGFVRVIRHSR